MLSCVPVYTFKFYGTPLDLIVTVDREGKVEIAPSWAIGTLTDRGMKFASQPGKVFEFLTTALRDNVLRRPGSD